MVFETTIPVFEQAETVHALDRWATVIGSTMHYVNKIQFLNVKPKGIRACGYQNYVRNYPLIFSAQLRSTGMVCGQVSNVFIGEFSVQYP
jgi:hypothetical protein